MAGLTEVTDQFDIHMMVLHVVDDVCTNFSFISTTYAMAGFINLFGYFLSEH